MGCDVCGRKEFSGTRHKCSVCYDYDLCDTCYNAFAVSQQHTNEHEMEHIEEPLWNEASRAQFIGTILIPEKKGSPTCQKGISQHPNETTREYQSSKRTDYVPRQSGPNNKSTREYNASTKRRNWKRTNRSQAFWTFSREVDRLEQNKTGRKVTPGNVPSRESGRAKRKEFQERQRAHQDIIDTAWDKHKQSELGS